MSKDWQDLFMRDAAGDDGTYPNLQQDVNSSPDVINRGPDSANILTAQQLINGYTNPDDPSNAEYNAVAGTVSRIYVRAKNLYQGSYPSWTEENQPRIYLRQMKPTIGYDISTMQLVPNANGSDYALLTPKNYGDICPGDQPFMLEGDPQNWGTHHCLCGTIVTPSNGDPFPTQDFTDWLDFVQWVRNYPNVCWHNVWTTTNSGTFCEQDYTFQNKTNTQRSYGFRASWQLPQNSTVRVWADPNTTVGFTGINKSQQVNGTPVDGLVSGSFTTSGTFPAGYETTIYLTVTTPDAQPLPAGATTSLNSLGATSLSSLHPSLRDIAVPLAQSTLEFQQEVLAALAPAGDQVSDLVTLSINGANVVYRPQQDP